MGRLFDDIRRAIQEDRFVIGWHADERCEQRGVSPRQIVAGFEDAELLRERSGSRPHPSIVVRQLLADGSEVECIWSWLAVSRRAKLVTVYFRD